MKYSKLILGAISLGVCASPAYADAVAPYAGVIVGYDHSKATLDPYDPESKDGLIYGGVAGVDYIFMGTSVLGAEAEVSGATTKQSFSDGVDSASLEMGRDLYAGVRAGFIPAPHFLLYVKGGYTNARLTGKVTVSGAKYSASENMDGWRLGAGAETAFKRFRVRLEYRYSDYGELFVQGFQTNVKVRRHQAVVGALYDF